MSDNIAEARDALCRLVAALDARTVRCVADVLRGDEATPPPRAGMHHLAEEALSVIGDPIGGLTPMPPRGHA